MTTPTFTDRQIQIIRLIADQRGFSYREIGARLGITAHTVRSMVVAIAAKLPEDYALLPPRWAIFAYWRAEYPAHYAKKVG